MKCDKCGNESIMFGQLHPVTRVDNTQNCGSLAGHGRYPNKKLICSKCLGWEDVNKKEKDNETS